MNNNKYENFFLFLSILFSVFIGVAIGLSISPVEENHEIVNIEEFGSKICESQGLSYSHYDMLKDSDNMKHIPKISCKKSPDSIYDGVVVLEMGD